MEIQLYTQEYQEQLANLYRQTWLDAPYYEVFTQDEAIEIIQKQTIILLALDQTGEIIGFIAGFPLNAYLKKDELNLSKHDRCFYFSELAVKPEHRKKGIARQLYEKLESYLKRHRYTDVYLRTSTVDTNPALSFYKHQFFNRIGGILSEVEQLRTNGDVRKDQRAYFQKTLRQPLLQIKAGENYSGIFERFKREHGIKIIIGISGGAEELLTGIHPEDEVQEMYKNFKLAYHTKIITSFLSQLKDYQVAILTGGTRGGIPELASKIAKSMGFKTIGVHPAVGRKYALDDTLLDLSISVDSLIGEPAWGDEGPVWTALIDAVVVIGGGAGTLTEYAHIQKINESRIKNGKRPKFIVPIFGTGGTAEQIPYLWAKPEVKYNSMPIDRIHSGLVAARYLMDKLSLTDYFEI